MGLMDKVKAGAETALNKAQQGVTQGKAKIDQAQAKHQWEGLLSKLGAAVYAEQRQGGPAEAVTAALGALDAHAATHGPGVEDGVAEDGVAEDGGADGAADGPAEPFGDPGAATTG